MDEKGKWVRPDTKTLMLGVLTVIVLFGTMRALEPVLKPLVFACVVAVLLSPVVNLLHRRARLPRGIALALALLVALACFFEAGVIINRVFSSFYSKYPLYMEKCNSLIGYFSGRLPESIAGSVKDWIRDLSWMERVSKMIVSVSGLLLSLSSSIVTVMIIAAFLLAEQGTFGAKIAKAFPAAEARGIGNVLSGISKQLSAYLGLQTAISAVTGVCVWLALWAIGVDFSGTWGVLAFVLNFIPTVGSIIASIPPVLVALVRDAPESYRQAILAASALLAIQMVIGNVISPRVMGDRLNLSPLVVLISLLFWAWLWGPAGALLSAPITAAIKIICENIPPLAFIGVLLGSGRVAKRKGQGRPARPPLLLR